MATFKTAISDIGKEDVDKENQYRGQRKEAPKILDKRFYPTEQNRRSPHFTESFLHRISVLLWTSDFRRSSFLPFSQEELY